MRGLRWPACATLAIATMSGCQSGSFAARKPAVVREPGLSSAVEPGKVVVETPPARAVTWVDRHPLFRKPRDYYESSGSNPVVKTAAATVLGIPAGIVGELRQIVVGTPVAQPVGSATIQPVGTATLPTN